MMLSTVRANRLAVWACTKTSVRPKRRMGFAVKTRSYRNEAGLEARPTDRNPSVRQDRSHRRGAEKSQCGNSPRPLPAQRAHRGMRLAAKNAQGVLGEFFSPIRFARRGSGERGEVRKTRRLGGGFNVALRADHGLKSGLQNAACYDNCLSGSGLRATGGRKPRQVRKEATVAVRFVCRGLPGAWHSPAPCTRSSRVNTGRRRFGTWSIRSTSRPPSKTPLRSIASPTAIFFRDSAEPGRPPSPASWRAA